MIELKEEAVFNAKAVLVCPRFTPSADPIRQDETAALCRTMGLDVIAVLDAPLKVPKAATYIGSGKVEQLAALADETGCAIAVFDCDLSPTMQLNLEQATGLCIIDRQEVIIQIFADRARTREARIQVDLARLKYSLPRLSRKWTSLSQTRGGVRGGKGAGEKQLELDRRYVESRIRSLQRELDKVKRQRSVQRGSRMGGDIPKIALVGYTNSGKSSLLNALCGSDVLAQDKLFATLDPVTRRLGLPDGSVALLTDTVGFVRDLPHQLIDSFRSTLEEAALADVLLLICDATHPDVLLCFETAIGVLEELGCKDRKTIVVINKMDALTPEREGRLGILEARASQITPVPVQKISVLTGFGLKALRNCISQVIRSPLSESEQGPCLQSL